MNVRITPRERLTQTILYGGIKRVYSDGAFLYLLTGRPAEYDATCLPMSFVAVIQLDDEPGDCF